MPVHHESNAKRAFCFTLQFTFVNIGDAETTKNKYCRNTSAVETIASGVPEQKERMITTLITHVTVVIFLFPDHNVSLISTWHPLAGSVWNQNAAKI